MRRTLPSPAGRGRGHIAIHSLSRGTSRSGAVLHPHPWLRAFFHVFIAFPVVCAWSVSALLATLLLPPVAAAADEEMTFTVMSSPSCARDCVLTVVGRGVITDQTARRFEAGVARRAGRLQVELDSPGGTLQGGFDLGVALRARGAAVRIAPGATCASACAYAFLGGTARSVLAGGRLGVHQHMAEVVTGGRRIAGEERIAIAEATLVLRRYVADMGADPGLIAMALSVQPNQMRFLTGTELSRYRVTTDAAGPVRVNPVPARRQPAGRPPASEAPRPLLPVKN